jgi:hypothetical protein
MHHTLTQALYEMFPRDEKGDFHHAYLYLKHLNHFMYHALKTAGGTPGKPEGELGEDVDEMLEAIVQGIAETAASRDTSTYHGNSLQAGPAHHHREPRVDLRRRMRVSSRGGGLVSPRWPAGRLPLRRRSPRLLHR